MHYFPVDNSIAFIFIIILLDHEDNPHRRASYYPTLKIRWLRLREDRQLSKYVIKSNQSGTQALNHIISRHDSKPHCPQMSFLWLAPELTLNSVSLYLRINSSQNLIYHHLMHMKWLKVNAYKKHPLGLETTVWNKSLGEFSDVSNAYFSPLIC